MSCACRSVWNIPALIPSKGFSAPVLPEIPLPRSVSDRFTTALADSRPDGREYVITTGAPGQTTPAPLGECYSQPALRNRCFSENGLALTPGAENAHEFRLTRLGTTAPAATSARRGVLPPRRGPPAISGRPLGLPCRGAGSLICLPDTASATAFSSAPKSGVRSEMSVYVATDAASQIYVVIKIHNAFGARAPPFR